MRVWTVHVRPPDRNRPPRTLLVRDGFAFGAFLAPVLWFAANRLFALAALALAATVALGALLPPAAAAPLLLGLQLFIGFEARALQSWWLGLRGWRTEGVVMGRNEDAAFLTLASARPDLARLAA
ncbi:DUF2628 domain-containing protein [Roseomonas alkaliterrae]|uniref:DUF2628 domain-containing protein n=1 Tax=Neoroseomonas alkaliterrae TaxID=1452450 RepID=A0A840XW10_9PROT|nr:DUF2628 domain-containing protein [Neoroseomonas alkaliterrae]MBB5688317.1 hypothetical protein [Neoroseomonas alkaliterrae]MBR0677109.1 DUF2628 domain-containing protein [Neoroseomonas alkaliterrae]